MHRTASQASSLGQPPGSPGVSSSLHKILKASFYEPPDCRSEDSGNFPVAVWSLKHFQWVLAVYATGVLIATSYASRAVYDLGEKFKDIIELLQLDASSSRLIDQAVSVSLLVSWLLAGGAIVGALQPFPLFHSFRPKALISIVQYLRVVVSCWCSTVVILLVNFSPVVLQD